MRTYGITAQVAVEKAGLGEEEEERQEEGRGDKGNEKRLWTRSLAVTSHNTRIQKRLKKVS